MRNRFAPLLVLIAAPVLAQPASLERGVNLRIYDIGRPMDRLYPLAAHQKPNIDRRIDAIALADEAAFGGPTDHFYAEIDGYLSVEVAGEYVLRLVSDDGSRLIVDADTLITNDGVHAPRGVEAPVTLSKGLHPYRIEFFENEGGAELRLMWKPPGADAFAPVPPSVLFVERTPERITAPGRKQVKDGREHMRPGDGMPLEGVHPGWAVDDLRPAGFEPQVGGMAFLPDGRLVISSFEPVNDGVLREEPNGTIWMLSGVIDGDPASVRAERIAGGFRDPTGLAVVDGDIYIAHKPDITRLRDSDGDGRFDKREVFVAPWVADNYHHFTFGLIEHQGWLYGSLSTSIYFSNTMQADNVRGDVIAMNGPNPRYRGTCFRVNLETRETEFLAGGFRTPNGIGLGPEDEIFVSDNQGAWLPASKLVNVRRGRFYGHANGQQSSDRFPLGGYPSLNQENGFSPPAVWLPQNECSNSPTAPLLIRSGEFAGQMYLGELTMGGIRRVFLERIDDEWQGAVFRFTQGFECGVNRLIEGPEGCLYVGGTGASGNWSWRGTRTGLQRLRPTGGSAFEYHSIRATPEGFVLRLTRPVAKEWLADPANYAITQWRYEPTPDYGGPKIDVAALAATGAAAEADGRSVALTIPGLRPGSVVHFRIDPRSEDGEAMWSTEAWYTLNRIPE